MYLVLRQGFFDLTDMNEFFYFHNLTCYVGCDGVEDCCHAFAEAEGFEDACGAGGETDGGTDEGYSEVGHCDWRRRVSDRVNGVELLLMFLGQVPVGWSSRLGVP